MKFKVTDLIPSKANPDSIIVVKLQANGTTNVPGVGPMPCSNFYNLFAPKDGTFFIKDATCELPMQHFDINKSSFEKKDKVSGEVQLGADGKPIILTSEWISPKLTA